MIYNENIAKWADARLKEAEKKVERCITEVGEKFPVFAFEDNKWSCTPALNEWTNGFWPGMLWITYLHAGNEKAKALAECLEEIMDEPLKAPEDLGHDVGFMWSLSSVANYKITGNDMSKRRAFRAAKSLASRFNPIGYIRSWNDILEQSTMGWSIVDNMMNLPILYWAAEEWSDRQAGLDLIARRHTETAITYTQRPDGSSNHIINLNPKTGEREYGPEVTQGRNIDSSWTRGQAWLIYGMALGARYTKSEEYLNAAKRTAHYFIAALDDTCVPPSDFRHGTEAPGRDGSAGACAACGLLEIAELVPDAEKQMYRRWAEKIVKGLYEHCSTDENAQNILTHCSTEFHCPDKYRDIGLIYGDYFYMEALYRLAGGEVIFW